MHVQLPDLLGLTRTCWDVMMCNGVVEYIMLGTAANRLITSNRYYLHLIGCEDWTQFLLARNRTIGYSSEHLEEDFSNDLHESFARQAQAVYGILQDAWVV